MIIRYLTIFIIFCCSSLQAQDSIIYLPVNIHYMLNENGEGSFSKNGSNDPKSDSTVNGYTYAQQIINKNNSKLAKNQQMNLHGEDSIISPPLINYRYILTGVYFHRDSILCYYSHNSPKMLLDKYGVQKDIEFNVFMTQWPKETPNEKRKSGGVAGCLGCGNYPSIALVDPWVDYKKYGCDGWLGPTFGTILNHEMGHLFGLMHNWAEDQCDDTPEHKRAWCGHDPEAGKFVDNNMMSYNCGQDAVTRCQLNKINVSFTSIHKSRVIQGTKSLKPAIGLFIMEDSIRKKDFKFLDGSWRLKSNRNETTFQVHFIKYKIKANQLQVKKKYSSKKMSGIYDKLNLEQVGGKKLKKGVYDIILEVQNHSYPPDSRSQRLVIW